MVTGGARGEWEGEVGRKMDHQREHATIYCRFRTARDGSVVVSLLFHFFCHFFLACSCAKPAYLFSGLVRKERGKRLLWNRFLCSTAEGLGATDLRAPWFRGPQVSGRVSLQYCRGDSSGFFGVRN